MPPLLVKPRPRAQKVQAAAAQSLSHHHVPPLVSRRLAMGVLGAVVALVLWSRRSFLLGVRGPGE